MTEHMPDDLDSTGHDLRELTDELRAGHRVVRNVRGEWVVTDRAQAWASVSYYGEETGNTLADVPAPGYTTADIGGSYELTDSITLNSSLNNLTDKRLDDETYGTVNYGRTLWMGATLNF